MSGCCSRLGLISRNPNCIRNVRQCRALPSYDHQTTISNTSSGMFSLRLLRLVTSTYFSFPPVKKTPSRQCALSLQRGREAPGWRLHFASIGNQGHAQRRLYVGRRSLHPYAKFPQRQNHQRLHQRLHLRLPRGRSQHRHHSLPRRRNQCRHHSPRQRRNQHRHRRPSRRRQQEACSPEPAGEFRRPHTCR